ncbi:MAG: hydrogenase maturation protease [Armatimonadota bacterium]|nr:hydrogenase maturation protease [Armatimonadota bacterium]MDR7468663.1 hydrogenase maturation protease [Armatimonadota bacterium]MDR7473786.1 hydrogenase maturation protease [Armatimonadota bacterium]MDR7538169.1 hydrogenase maturation protease [Armatimonadota bacterium]
MTGGEVGRLSMYASPPEPRERVAARVLCLGNPLLADDALGAEVAGALAGRLPPGTEVVQNELTGFGLLDDLLEVPRLVVVDTVRTGTGPPGTVHLIREDDLRSAPGPSPHYVGLLEMLHLARTLGLPAPQEVVVLAVEASDCTTIGGAMHPALQEAVSLVVELVVGILQDWAQPAPVSRCTSWL